MVSWIARIVLIVAGALVSWAIAEDAEYYRTAQLSAALILFVLVVLAAAFWPARWRETFDRLLKR